MAILAVSVFSIVVSTGCGDGTRIVNGHHKRRHPVAPLTTSSQTDLGSDIPAGGGSPDALAPDTDTEYKDPLDPDNSAAKLGQQDKLDDTIATGVKQKMPTEHSHWLRISQFQSQITVRLNGVWYGEFYGAADRDITMSLRAGENTITVTYQPQAAGSWMDLKVLESEHDPPIPPLVAYSIPPRRTSLSAESNSLTPVTKMFSFEAK